MLAWQDTASSWMSPAKSMHCSPVWAATRPWASTIATCRVARAASAASSCASASGADTP